MNNRRYVAMVFYCLYGIFIVVPVLLSLVPISWGPVFTVVERVFNFLPFGYATTLTVLVTPFVFLWLYRKERTREYLIASVVSALVLIFILVSAVLVFHRIQV